MPLDVLIREEHHDDDAVVTAVVEAAFGRAVEARLVDAIRTSPGYVPELSLVAVVDGLIVGHVMVSMASLDHDEKSRPIGVLAPLAVVPDLHRRGAGSALVTEVLARAEALGLPLVVLEGDPRYYSRFGFESAARRGIRIDLPSWAPPEAAQVHILTCDDGTMRGRVAYPPAFHMVTG